MPDLPEAPLNREPDIQTLTSTFLTPAHLAYDRNHGVVPSSLSSTTHRVRIDGAVSQPLSLSVEDLHNDFPQHTVVCALQCAGNRRHTMRTKLQEVQGIDWGDAAVMNCRWRGPRLADVLGRAGIAFATEAEREEAHVAFACYSAPCQDEEWYGASIPLARALRADAEVILALEMNDEPLTRNHGYPVRVIAPGIAGARAVKWLDRVTVQERESENVYMQRDYKVLPPNVVSSEQAEAEGWWEATPAVQEMPVNSVIADPVEGGVAERDADGLVMVTGYAVPSGDDGPVTKVEVSGDGGRSWTDAEMVGEGMGKWSWRFWRARVKISDETIGRTTTIYSRATDRAGNTQPVRSQWNLRGVCYCGYGEVADVSIMGGVMGCSVGHDTMDITPKLHSS